MADFGDQAAGYAVNTGLNGLARAAGNRLPLPSFYNPNSPNHFADSEAGRMAHGDRKAWTHFATRQGGRVLGATLGNIVLPGFGGLLGGMVGGWLGGKIGKDDKQPTGTVTVGNINDTSGFDGIQQIDPWTGAPLPQFSEQGPYASGYQGLPQDTSGAVFPDFSNYGGGESGGGDFNASEAGTGVGNGDFSGMGGWNNASSSMMADFAAPTNGDWMQRIGTHTGQNGPSAQAKTR